MKLIAKLSVLTAMLCANAVAAPVFLPPAQNLTYGASSNNQSIMSSVTNPAAAAAQLGKEDSQYRFGILSSIGVGYEFGNIDNLYNQIDQAAIDIKTPITTAELAALADPTPAVFANNIVNFINNTPATTSLNNILNAVQQNGNATVFFGGYVPLMPLVVTKKNWGGSFVLDINVNAVANLSFLADPFLISSATATAFANAYIANNTNPNLPPPTNDSTLLVKAAGVGELGLGYSRPVLQRETGSLTAGVRAKYYVVKLARVAQKLTSTNGAQNTFDNTTFNYTTSTGIGLDVGTLWTAKRYRVGAWINNLNKPSFEYNTIDTTSYDVTKAVKGQLDAGDTYEMKPQLELEGAFYSESQNWVLNAGLDANAVPDPVGRDFQWATLSAAYATDSWWIPGARVGYRTNLAGSKLSYVTAGLTLFKALSLDLAYGLDSVKDKNNNSIPRSAMINLGLQLTF